MDPLYEKVLSILDSKEKIPHVRKIGEYYYNFWQDSVNPRGVWRRTSLKSYRNMSTEWELVLDVDALGREEGQSWVWGGATAHHPDDLNELPTRALLLLSQGGSDAKTMREFDLVSKRFVSLEEGGFQLTEPAKCRFSWLNRDTLLAGTNVDGIMEGVSDSLTDSGYPRLILEWTRGTRLSAARVAFEGEKGDVSISGYVSKHRGHSVEWRHRAMTFYTAKHWVRFINETAWHELPLQVVKHLDSTHWVDDIL
jgi:prolyl oligopeptidase